MVALVVQRLYTGLTSPWSFEHVQSNHTKVTEEVGYWKEADENSTTTHRHWLQNGCTMVGQCSGHPVKMLPIVNISQTERCLWLPSTYTTPVPPLTDQWLSLSDQCVDHCASIRRPGQTYNYNGNRSASTLPPLRDLSASRPFWWIKKSTQVVCYSSYIETGVFLFRRLVSVPDIFLVAQRWHEGHSPV